MHSVLNLFCKLMQCFQTASLDAFFTHFLNSSQETYLSTLCCGCSTATIPVAEVSHYWNIPQVYLFNAHTQTNTQAQLHTFLQIWSKNIIVYSIICHPPCPFHVDGVCNSCFCCQRSRPVSYFLSDHSFVWVPLSLTCCADGEIQLVTVGRCHTGWGSVHRGTFSWHISFPNCRSLCKWC